MVPGWIHDHHDCILLHGSLPGKMISAVIMEGITLFLKGAGAAIAVYAAILQKRDQ